MTSVTADNKTKKKRDVDWPQDFVPGTSNNCDLSSLDMPSFTAGFLAMVKKYEKNDKENTYALLELIATKSIKYSWSSVRGFNAYIACQVEQWRLEWSRIAEIRDASATFFKHSDLRTESTKARSTRHITSGSMTNAENPKGCQTWNYKGSCSCDSSSDSYTSTHVCRVCKSSDHPMLNCPKRRMPIPGNP